MVREGGDGEREEEDGQRGTGKGRGRERERISQCCVDEIISSTIFIHVHIPKLLLS